MRMWRNWQTRWIQVPVIAISCGFKSHHPHQKTENSAAVLRFFLQMGLEPNRTTAFRKRFCESFLAGELCERKQGEEIFKEKAEVF